MIVANIANSNNDEYYTPGYAVQPILNYVRPGASVWCPFDTEDSLFVKMLRDHGCRVVATHINEGKDFFETEPPKGCEVIVSNPPYTRKGDVLARLFKLGVPFAMLVGVVGLFESQARFEMFRDNDFEVLYLNRRVSFLRSYADIKPCRNPPFSSVYVCHKLLPKQICFAEIKK